MSYDLMVFEKTKVPKTKEAFLEWFSKQTEWTEDHDYQSISVSSPALQGWFLEIKDTFPPMNGEYAPSMEQLDQNPQLEISMTDYSIGREMIYAAFAWSVADDARELVVKLAQKHGVGFFDVSTDDCVVLLPDGTEIT